MDFVVVRTNAWCKLKIKIALPVRTGWAVITASPFQN
jgi:hypothetical protein